MGLLCLRLIKVRVLLWVNVWQKLHRGHKQFLMRLWCRGNIRDGCRSWPSIIFGLASLEKALYKSMKID